MRKIASKPIQRFKKGDAFVEMTPCLLVFMKINDAEGGFENKDLCIVTRYSLDEKGRHTQRRFPMVACDGKFSDLEPIHAVFSKRLKMRQYVAEAKQLTDKKKAKSLCNEYKYGDVRSQINSDIIVL